MTSRLAFFMGSTHIDLPGTTRRASLVLFVLSMALTGVLLIELPGAAQSPSSVQGQVFAYSGSRPPLPGIHVELLDRGFEVVGTDETDTHGEYEFADTRAGDYLLRFSDPRPCRDQPFASAQREIDRSQFSRSTVGGNMFLRDGSSIRGVVTDDQDRPLSGVEVRVVGDDVDFEATAVTLEDGSWWICRLPAGSYDITFRSGDRVQDVEDLRLDEGEHQSFPVQFSSQVSTAGGGGDDTEVLGTLVTLQQATGTPTTTASPSPTPTPSPTPVATVAPGGDDNLPETGLEVVVLGTIGTWTLFLGMLLLHVATRRTERLRSLDGYL